MVTYAKISPKMVNPRDIAGNAKEEEGMNEQADLSGCSSFHSAVQFETSKEHMGQCHSKIILRKEESICAKVLHLVMVLNYSTKKSIRA